MFNNFFMQFLFDPSIYLQNVLLVFYWCFTKGFKIYIALLKEQFFATQICDPHIMCSYTETHPHTYADIHMHKSAYVDLNITYMCDRTNCHKTVQQTNTEWSEWHKNSQSYLQAATVRFYIHIWTGISYLFKNKRLDDLTLSIKCVYTPPLFSYIKKVNKQNVKKKKNNNVMITKKSL